MNIEKNHNHNTEQQSFKEKSPEHLQAQVEIFADKSVKSLGENKAKLLKYSAELSKIKDLNNLPTDLPVEIIGLIKKYKKYYIDFLRQEGKIDNSIIEENIKNYKERFEPTIKELKAKLKAEVSQMSQEDLKKIPEYLGSGTNGSVFLIEIDKKKYAAKLFYNFTQENFEIKGLSAAKGIAHVPQITSYSFADSVIITELLQGIPLENLIPNEELNYPDNHIIQLIETIKELNTKGLIVDFGPGNFLYDKEKGFPVLDFYIHEESIQKNENKPDLWREIINIERPLISRRFERMDSNDPNYDEKLLEQYKISLPIIAFLKISILL